MKKYKDFNEFIHQHEGISGIKVSEALEQWVQYCNEYTKFEEDEKNKIKTEKEELIEKMKLDPLSYSFKEVDDYTIVYYLVKGAALNCGRVMIICDTITIEMDIYCKHIESFKYDVDYSFYYDKFNFNLNGIYKIDKSEIEELDSTLKAFTSFTSKSFNLHGN